MAFYSLVMYAGNGSNRNFTIHFPYLDKSHVKVKVSNANTTEFTWLTSSSIQFNTAPAAGANIEIYRETPLNYVPVDFTDGSILLERDLDLLTIFNLYVDQEIADKAARAIALSQEAKDLATRAISMGSGGGGGGGADAAAAAAARVAAEAARVAAEKAAREAEAARDAAIKAGAGGGGGGGATSGAGKFSSLSVKGKPDSWLDLYADSAYSSSKCGVNYSRGGMFPEYQDYYSSRDGIFRHAATNVNGEWRWSIEGFDNVMSFKRGPSWLGAANDHYVLSVGDPSSASSGMGGALHIHGTSAAGRTAKLSLYNDNQLQGGVVSMGNEMHLVGPEKVSLRGGKPSSMGDPLFEAWRDRASLTYSTERNNRFDWQADGNVVLFRGGAAVWAINNYLTSDVRLKTDIKPLEGSSLEKVKQLNAKTYLWKDDLMGKGDKREIGLIAQEVAEVVPEVVSKMSKTSDNLGVAYIQLVPLLVEAVKELSAKVESLEAQLMSKE